MDRNGVCCYINKTLFKKYWDVLRKQKLDKTHNATDMSLYYSLFQNESDEVFVEAIKLILKELSYFPKTDEMNYYINQVKEESKLKKLSGTNTTPELDEEDKAFARGFYKRYCDTEEEYQERLKKYGLE